MLIAKSPDSDLPWNQSDKILARASSFFFGKVSVQAGAARALGGLLFDFESKTSSSKIGGRAMYSVFDRRCEGRLWNRFWDEVTGIVVFRGDEAAVS